MVGWQAGVAWTQDGWVDRTCSADKSGHVIARTPSDIDRGLVAHGQAAIDVMRHLLSHRRTETREARVLRVYTCCDIQSIVYDDDVCAVMSRIQPVEGDDEACAGAAFIQMGFALYRQLPPRGTPARAAFTLQLAERAAEQVRLRLREFLGHGVKLQEWIGTAWELRLRAYPPGDGRDDITFENIRQMDEFFSAYMPRDADGMPILQPDDD